MAEKTKLTKKSRRCYHRVMSGLERGGSLRFLTLTSSLDAPSDIQRSWRAIYMRMKRRNLVSGYIKCPELTENGAQHLHVLFRGKYISQRLISLWWSEIHNSPIVHIKMFRPYGSKKRIASYMAKYMSKEMAGRYSWSWGWVWRGFAGHWSSYKRWWSRWYERPGKTSFNNCLAGWRFWLRGYLTVDIPYLIMDYPPSFVISWTHGDTMPIFLVRSYEG